MQMPYEWWIGWRYTRAGRGVRRNGFISFISGVSMVGIALGVAALIIVLSVMNGFQKEVLGKMLNVVSHIELVAADGEALPDLPALTERVRQQPQVAGIAPFVSLQALVARGEAMQPAILRGIDPAAEAQVSDMARQPQVQAALAALKPGEFGIVPGVQLARSLGVRAGDRVTVVTPNGQLGPAGVSPTFRQFTVVGVFDSGHYEYDQGMAMVHVQDGARLQRVSGPTGLRVRLHDLHQAGRVAAELERRLNTDPAHPLMARDWSQQNRTWFAAVQVEKRMMFIILTLIVAVAAFNLVSTLVMTVTDKRADIAILRTLGASPRSIMGIFVVQGALVGVIGTLLGLLLGLGVAYRIDVIVPAIERLFNAKFLPPELYLISQMPSDPQRGDIVPIAIISLVLAFVATLYPSWRASRVNPAQALRYE